MTELQRDKDASQPPASSAAVFTLTPTSIAVDGQEPWRQALIDESVQIETAAAVWGGAYRRRAAFFNSIGTSLALVSGLVATLAGGTALGWSATAGGVLALIAAALAAVSTTVSPGVRTGEEQAGAIANTNLADAARVFRTTVARYGSYDDALSGFKTLIEQRDEVVRCAPIESRGTLHKVEREVEKKLKGTETGRVVVT
jgi:hypothetical protein